MTRPEFIRRAAEIGGWIDPAKLNRKGLIRTGAVLTPYGGYCCPVVAVHRADDPDSPCSNGQALHAGQALGLRRNTINVLLAAADNDPSFLWDDNPPTRACKAKARKLTAKVRAEMLKAFGLKEAA